jgi:hypothetical protein
MKGLGVWLVTSLISKWGAAVVLIGTLALAGSVSVYLARSYNPQTHGGTSASGMQPPVSLQCARSVPVVAYLRVAAGQAPLSCASDH